jgi:hypothetical protein
MTKAKECARNSNIPLKASHGWCEKFMKKESLSLQPRTKINQKFPSDFETRLIEHQCFVIGLHQRNNYSLSQIGNADETAIFFYMPHNYALNFRGENQVAMKTTGYKTLHVTIMLCITANGNKSSPYIVLNRKTLPKENFAKI